MLVGGEGKAWAAADVAVELANVAAQGAQRIKGQAEVRGVGIVS